MIIKTDDPIKYRRMIRLLEKMGLYFRTLSKWTDKTHIIQIGKEPLQN